jgi:Phenazine biosynthesis-like protein
MEVPDERAGFTSARRMSAPPPQCCAEPLEEPAIDERCLPTRPAQTERNGKKRASRGFRCSAARHYRPLRRNEVARADASGAGPCRGSLPELIAGLAELGAEGMGRMDILRIAAFSNGSRGGNPAGVVLCAEMPDAAKMQHVAAEIGYSETVFAMPQGDKWRVRYFAPEAEVDFCGHATIALGAALALRHGDGTFPLQLNQVRITVEGRRVGNALSPALKSPPTRSRPAGSALLAEALALFDIPADELDPKIPPSIAHAGADHLVLALRDRNPLSAMA